MLKNISISIFLLSFFILISCKSKDMKKSDPSETEQTIQEMAKTGIVNITAQDFKFLLPDTIPSGWVNMKFHNNGKETHFFMLNKIPDGITFNEYLNALQPPFDKVIKALRDSGITQQEAGKRLMAQLPSWTSKIQTMGGSGLIEPGGSVDFTLKLIPGSYEMECYVFTSSDMSHYQLGMTSHVIVSEDSTNRTPPKADINLTLSDHKIIPDVEPTAGEHIVAVHFKDPQSFGIGDDVHLVELTDTTNMNNVIEWMNWMNKDGLTAPAPARFLGGVQEMPQGYTEYFKVNFKPGNYAWVGESYAGQGMVTKFSID
jgi:hypothetical protein